MKKQGGYLNLDFGAVFIVFGLICAVGGWLIIELLIWLFSHIDISWAA